MEIKSQPKQPLCKRFIRALENGSPTAIVGLVAGITLSVFAMIQIPQLIDEYKAYSKYNEIVETKPILRCGQMSDPILPSNYQAFRVDDKKLIRVYYSKDSFRDFTSPECKVLSYDTNANLETDRIHQTIGQLRKEKTQLETILKSKNIEIKKLETKITQIRDDYKLPTFEDLDKLYEKFSNEKRKDFDRWIAKEKAAELKKLEVARAEYSHKTIDYSCGYDEYDIPTDLWDLWMTGNCDEFTKAMRKRKK